MGWSHSVTISQAIHGEILYGRAGLNKELEITGGNSNSDLRCRFGRYIDDFFVFGTDGEEVERVYNEVYRKFEECGLPPKASKCQAPSPETTSILGIEISPNGELNPDQIKLKRLKDRTQMLLDSYGWNVNRLQHVLGHWNWFLLLNRPGMGVLRRCYDLSTSKKPTVKACKEAKHELYLLMCLAPLIFSCFNRSESPVMLCSDASMDGGASLYSESELVHPIQSTLVSKARDALDTPIDLQEKKWKTIWKGKWKYRKHINVLEGRALLTGVRWMTRQRPKLETVVPVLTDSQVWFYILAKGRSGAERLYRLARRISALCLAGNLRLVPIWVPSALNPADAPSREF